MCGIIYYHNSESNSAIKSIRKRYYEQKQRGSDGFGFALFNLDDMKITHYIREAEEKDILADLESIVGNKEIKTNACLFHHRFPTSTPNLAECAHPIEIVHPDFADSYLFVHNGVINNASDLKPIHDGLGFKYDTEIKKEEAWITRSNKYAFEPTVKFNDSESLGIEIARFIEGKSKEVSAKGTIAFVMLRLSKDGTAKKLYYGRNHGNPLHLEKDKHSFCLKSVGRNMDLVDANKLYCYDYTTKETTEEKLEFPGNYYHPRDRDSDYDPRSWNPRTASLSEHLDETKVELLPSPRSADPMNVMTVDEYFEEVSQTHASVDEWLREGNTLDELMTFTLEESYVVEDLLIGATGKDKERLQRRGLELTTRIRVLESREAIIRDLEEEIADERRMGYR